MAYHPFGDEGPRKFKDRGPQIKGRMQPYPGMENATSDEMQMADPDFLPQDGDMDEPVRARTDPEYLLREQLEQLESVNSELQDEHTRLERQIGKMHAEAERLFGMKMRVEGQIEMVQVTHKSTAEQLRLFQERGQD